MCEIYESQYLRQNCNWKNVHCARSLVTDIGKAEEWMYQPKRKGEGRENEQNCETKEVQDTHPENRKKALDAAVDAAPGSGICVGLLICAHDGNRPCVQAVSVCWRDLRLPVGRTG